MKNIIKKWLEKLGESNKENFGTERLDCCTVGKGKEAVKSMNATKKSR